MTGIDPQLLTAAFEEAGFGGSTVASVSFEPMPSEGLAADFLVANISYKTNEPDLPQSMVVKCPRLTDRGEGEANVYRNILRDQEYLPILNCFAIVDRSEPEPLMLFFDDLRAGYHQTTWPLIPDFVNCKQAVATLARVHANWWGSENLPDGSTSPIARHQEPRYLLDAFPAFVDYVGDNLSESRGRVMEKVLTQLDSLMSERLGDANRTLLHSDPHFWNFLYPSKPGREAIVYDWALWRTGLAGWDLAYLIALHLYPAHREAAEPLLLAHYHEALQANGVDYSLEDVEFDYRLGVLAGLMMPIMEFTWQVPPSDWIPKQEKAFAAFDALDCQALLNN